MKALVNLAVVVAAVSLILGVVSRFTVRPLPIVRGGLEANALMAFTNTCLLFAIVLILLKKKE